MLVLLRVPKTDERTEHMTQPIPGEAQQPEPTPDTRSPEERHDQFVAEAEEQGLSKQSAEDVYKIITELSPPIAVQNVEALGIPFGESQIRVGREYDGELAARDLDGYTDVMLHTPLGLVSFSVDKASLVRALTVEVPNVPPTKAPADA